MRWLLGYRRGTYLGILDLQASRRQDKRHQRSGEEHLEKSDIALGALEAFRKGVGIVDSEPSRGA